MIKPVEIAGPSSPSFDSHICDNPKTVSENICNAPVGTKPWTRVSEEEVAHAFMEHDPVFKRYLQTRGLTPTAKSWITDLTRVMNQRTQKMPPGTKGLELVFRFRQAYGAINHVALATCWRDGSGKLKMGFLHQENIPVFDGKQPKPSRFVGRVFDKFDTREHFSDGKCPIEKSLEHAGPPDLMVNHCPRPERIAELQEVMKNVPHPYGAFGPADDEGMAPLTCFSVTHAAHLALHGDEACMDTRSTIPHIAKAMTKENGVVGGTDYEALRKFEYRGKEYDLESPDMQPPQLLAAFKSVGSKWGDAHNANTQWDVSPRDAIKSRL
jgi:hypothetical protein